MDIAALIQLPSLVKNLKTWAELAKNWTKFTKSVPTTSSVAKYYPEADGADGHENI
jgi:hypothetical protein